MECTKCHKILSIDNFSLKKNNIYYLHCEECRKKYINNIDKKNKEKDAYNLVKKINIVNCSCGVSYVAFRDFHITRHINSYKHLSKLI